MGQPVCAVMIQNGRVQTSIKYFLKSGNSFSVYTGGSSSMAMEVSVSEGLSFSFAGVVALGDPSMASHCWESRVAVKPHYSECT